MAAGQWVKFFNASGIPASAAATYAHIFVENRIQNDMLLELNKEHLREMGITLMGDIIAILRHAKIVSDQTAREKVLGGNDTVNHIPVAAVSPASPSPSHIRLNALSNTLASTSAAVVNPIQSERTRSVKPMEEGGYTVKLPSGNTERSKEILAKQAKLYANGDNNKETSGVFRRLKLSDSDQLSVVKNNQRTMTTAHKQTTKKECQFSDITIHDSSKQKTSVTSIFSRLGEKDDDREATNSTGIKEIKPILKKTAKNRLSTIVKAKASSPVVFQTRNQKVLLVKKVPTKSCDSDTRTIKLNSTRKYQTSDESDTDATPANGSEKIVKFATTAEVCEISNVDRCQKTEDQRRMAMIKTNCRKEERLYSLKTTSNMKPATPTKYRKETVQLMIKDALKSKEQNGKGSVHKRLGYNSKYSMSSSYSSESDHEEILNRKRDNFRLNSSSRMQYYEKSAKRKVMSVFDRLGFH